MCNVRVHKCTRGGDGIGTELSVSMRFQYRLIVSRWAGVISSYKLSMPFEVSSMIHHLGTEVKVCEVKSHVRFMTVLTS